jgi:oligoribonuclease NrnB/cAMP/cGMP phosphodiesterase (DHH superfamily)
MKYDIYFHDDFDGRACAAVMLAFLRSRGDDIEHYTPLDFDILPQWIDEGFFKKHRLFRGKRNPAIVMDFPYHPKAAFWFDHHPTTFKKESWKKKFRPSKFRRLEPRYPSCCHLVYASLKKDFHWAPPKHITELVRWLDIIDGARYKTPKQTIVIKEAALEVDAYIEKSDRNVPSTIHLINMLSQMPIGEVARLPDVQAIAKEARIQNIKNLEFYKKHLKRFGQATFIDLTKDHSQGLRYAPYYLFPNVIYAIRLTPKHGLFPYHIGVGANPWRPGKNKIHLGELAMKLGGGGHKGAAGIEFKTRDAAERAINEILTHLNKKK